MPYSPDSLFNLSMNFVAEYLSLVESFVGFPSLVAETIFQKYAIRYSGENCDSMHTVLKHFVEAYENLILERLNLSNRLLILNEYFDTIIIIARFVSELCVCECSLGENHDLFSHISEFKRLKKLCMKNNAMTDHSLRLLTLRIRTYGIGGRELEFFNMSGNNFTDNIIPWLSAFPKLQCLNLSGSNISKEGIQTLASRYKLQHVAEEDPCEISCTHSEGWAVLILEKWIKHEEERKKKREKKLIFKRNISSILKPCHMMSSNKSLVFRKVLSLDNRPVVPIAKRRKISPDCNYKKIEEDLFSLYR